MQFLLRLGCEPRSLLEWSCSGPLLCFGECQSKRPLWNAVYSLKSCCGQSPDPSQAWHSTASLRLVFHSRRCFSLPRCLVVIFVINSPLFLWGSANGIPHSVEAGDQISLCFRESPGRQLHREASLSIVNLKRWALESNYSSISFHAESPRMGPG